MLFMVDCPLSGLNQVLGIKIGVSACLASLRFEMGIGLASYSYSSSESPCLRL